MEKRGWSKKIISNFILGSELRRIQQNLIQVYDKDPNWNLLNSSLYGEYGMSTDFVSVLPNSNQKEVTYYSKSSDEKMRDYLKENFGNLNRGIVFVEMGGPGVRLAKDINSVCKIDTSIGLTLQKGLEMAIEKNELKPEETPDFHEIICGDMFNKNFFLEFKKKLNNKKIDLLIERMKGGALLLTEACCHPFWYFKHINEWYKLLNKNGSMFIEIPTFALQDFGLDDYWPLYMKNQVGIEFSINKRNSYFRLKKLENAPDNLPSSFLITKKLLK